MKKFTLTLAACIVALGSMAQKRVESKFAEKFKAQSSLYKKDFKLLENLKTTYVKSGTPSLADVVSVNKAQGKRFSAPAYAEDEVAAEQGHMFASYYNEYLGDALPVNMVDVLYATFEEEGNKFLLLDIYGLDPIYGIIKSGSSYEGVDSIIFMNNIEVGRLNTGASVYACQTTLSKDSTNAVVATRMSGSETFGGYYFPATGEIFIPEFIGLYAGDETTPFNGDYVYGYIDVLSGLDNYITKATVTGSVYKGKHSTYTVDDAASLMIDNSVYVRGLDPNADDIWLEISMGEDGNGAVYGQYLATYNFYTDETQTSTVPVPVLVMPAKGSFTEAKLSAWADTIPVTTEYDIYDNVLLSFGSDDVVAVDYALGLGWIDLFTNVSVALSSELANETDVKGVTAATKNEVKSVEFFDIQGRRVDNAAKGLVIRKVTYADGKTVSRKVVK